MDLSSQPGNLRSGHVRLSKEDPILKKYGLLTIGLFSLGEFRVIFLIFRSFSQLMKLLKKYI